jgi:hypothetical protein
MRIKDDGDAAHLHDDSHATHGNQEKNRTVRTAHPTISAKLKTVSSPGCDCRGLWPRNDGKAMIRNKISAVFASTAKQSPGSRLHDLIYDAGAIIGKSPTGWAPTMVQRKRCSPEGVQRNLWCLVLMKQWKNAAVDAVAR